MSIRKWLTIIPWFHHNILLHWELRQSSQRTAIDIMSDHPTTKLSVKPSDLCLLKIKHSALLGFNCYLLIATIYMCPKPRCFWLIDSLKKTREVQGATCQSWNTSHQKWYGEYCCQQYFILTLYLPHNWNNICKQRWIIRTV